MKLVVQMFSKLDFRCSLLAKEEIWLGWYLPWLLAVSPSFRFLSSDIEIVTKHNLWNLQGELSAQIIKSEGPRALYLGLGPALTRSVLYGGLRLGLYEPCKYICDYMFGSTNFLVKVASGAFSGAIATALTNPAEVLKVEYCALWILWNCCYNPYIMENSLYLCMCTGEVANELKCQKGPY